MHAQHLGSDVVWARAARFQADAGSSRLAHEAKRVRPSHGASASGSVLCVRVLEPTDAEHLQLLFEQLSTRSRWLRYLAPLRKLSGSELRRLSSIDHETHEALGAFDGGELVAVAHYFRYEEDPSAPRSASKWPIATSVAVSARAC